jgi:hypothetical protein
MGGSGRRQDHYQVLGVAPDAPDEVIKAAYRALAAKYHPDRNPGDRDAELKLKRLNAAIAVLGDPEKRRQYDELTQGPEHDEAAEASAAPPPPPQRPQPPAPVERTHESATSGGTCEHCGAPMDDADRWCRSCKRARTQKRTSEQGSTPRVLVALFAVGVSLFVNLSEQPRNEAYLVGLVIGCGVLALFIYWLSGKISPILCGVGVVLLAAVVLASRSSPGDGKTHATSGAAITTTTPSPTPTAAVTVETMRLYDKDGNPVDLPYDLATDAYVAGTYGIPKDSQVAIVMPRSGIVQTLRAEQVWDALNHGARFATPEEAAQGYGFTKPGSTSARPAPKAPSTGQSDVCLAQCAYDCGQAQLPPAQYRDCYSACTKHCRP